MGGKKLRFIYCVETLMLAFATMAQAQAVTDTPTPSPTATATWTSIPTSTPTTADTPTPTPTPTFDPWAKPTPTPIWDFFATNTFTPVVSQSPTVVSATPIITSTPTVTGTITPPATPTPTWTSTPSISRASLALLPTAYSNAWDRWNGLNWDISFSYYIGSIAERAYSSPNTDFLNPLRIWLLTSDLKYGWLDENGNIPAVGSGLLMSLLLQGGNPGATGSGSQSFQLTGNSMGGVYTVVSKTIAKDTAVHFGYIQGFNDAFNSIGIGFLAPNKNYSELLPLLTPKLSDVLGESPSSIFYTGFNTRLLGTNWKFEVWKPFPMNENPILFNSQVDGLFAFNLAYERWDSGFALLGYFNFRFTIIPVPPDY